MITKWNRFRFTYALRNHALRILGRSAAALMINTAVAFLVFIFTLLTFDRVKNTHASFDQDALMSPHTQMMPKFIRDAGLNSAKKMMANSNFQVYFSGMPPIYPKYGAFIARDWNVAMDPASADLHVHWDHAARKLTFSHQEATTREPSDAAMRHYVDGDFRTQVEQALFREEISPSLMPPALNPFIPHLEAGADLDQKNLDTLKKYLDVTALVFMFLCAALPLWFIMGMFVQETHKARSKGEWEHLYHAIDRAGRFFFHRTIMAHFNILVYSTAMFVPWLLLFPASTLISIFIYFYFLMAATAAVLNMLILRTNNSFMGAAYTNLVLALIWIFFVISPLYAHAIQKHAIDFLLEIIQPASVSFLAGWAIAGTLIVVLSTYYSSEKGFVKYRS